MIKRQKYLSLILGFLIGNLWLGLSACGPALPNEIAASHEQLPEKN